jgi:peptide/nickel transport system substrate-binding protein
MTAIPLANRRQVLKLGALAAAASGGLSLAGCGNSPAKPAPLTTLRVGAADANNSTGLDPRTASNGASLIVVGHLYDSLMVLEDNAFKMRLAESVEPNADGTRWTIRIRSGVTFHDGRPVRAPDVAYTLKTLAAKPSNRASLYADVDTANLKVIDPLTVEVPLKRPRGDFRESVLVVYSTVFPEGTTDFTKPIGSGPFKLAGSDAGTVRLVAVDKHWSGTPTVKTLDISRIADAAARLNAVRDGQIDFAAGISATGAQAERQNKALTILRGGAANSNALSFAMNQRLAPFNDPRVRQAVRLSADRSALVANALLGLGTVGADVVGKGLPGYANGISDRVRDVATARQLFAAAGVTELTLRAAEVVPGMLSAARLFGQQLSEAGIKLNVQEEPADTYYANLAGLAGHPFQVFYYSNRPAAVHLASTTNQFAPFNVTGTGPEYWKQLAAAQVSTDDAQRATAFGALEMDFYRNGGDVLWGYQETLNVCRTGVTGVRMSQSIPQFTRTTVTA